MKRLVDVEGNAADEPEAHTDDAQAELRGGGRAAAHVDALNAPKVSAHAASEEGHDHTGEHEGAVEERTRGVMERAQAAEVQLPPQRVARGEDRGEDAAAQHHEGDRRELSRRRAHGESRH